VEKEQIAKTLVEEYQSNYQLCLIEKRNLSDSFEEYKRCSRIEYDEHRLKQSNLDSELKDSYLLISAMQSDKNAHSTKFDMLAIAHANLIEKECISSKLLEENISYIQINVIEKKLLADAFEKYKDDINLLDKEHSKVISNLQSQLHNESIANSKFRAKNEKLSYQLELLEISYCKIVEKEKIAKTLLEEHRSNYQLCLIEKRNFSDFFEEYKRHSLEEIKRLANHIQMLEVAYSDAISRECIAKKMIEITQSDYRMLENVDSFDKGKSKAEASSSKQIGWQAKIQEKLEADGLTIPTSNSKNENLILQLQLLDKAYCNILDAEKNTKALAEEYQSNYETCMLEKEMILKSFKEYKRCSRIEYDEQLLIQSNLDSKLKNNDLLISTMQSDNNDLSKKLEMLDIAHSKVIEQECIPNTIMEKNGSYYNQIILEKERLADELEAYKHHSRVTYQEQLSFHDILEAKLKDNILTHSSHNNSIESKVENLAIQLQGFENAINRLEKSVSSKLEMEESEKIAHSTVRDTNYNIIEKMDIQPQILETVIGKMEDNDYTITKHNDLENENLRNLIFDDPHAKSAIRDGSVIHQNISNNIVKHYHRNKKLRSEPLRRMQMALKMKNDFRKKFQEMKSSYLHQINSDLAEQLKEYQTNDVQFDQKPLPFYLTFPSSNNASELTLVGESNGEVLVTLNLEATLHGRLVLLL
jgi:hypothetical protein